jgi:hypothetical protein
LIFQVCLISSSRPFNSLVDSASDGDKLTGNCSQAQTVGGGPNEAYPCVMDLIDYGWAIQGLVDPLNKYAFSQKEFFLGFRFSFFFRVANTNRLIPTSLSISGDGGYEPNQNTSLTGMKFSFSII